MTELYIIRHAEAEGNVFRRFHGQYNSLLTPRGYLQRACLEKRFSDIAIDACYSSDLTRASLTSRAIYVPKKLQLQRRKDLRECDVGAWEDLSFGELAVRYPLEMYHFLYDFEKLKCTDGESFWTMTDRFISAIKQIAAQHDGETVAIFAHGAVIKGALLRLFFWNDRDSLPLSDNTGVSRLFFDGNEFTYDYVNDASHLPYELTTEYMQRWWSKDSLVTDANLCFVPLRQWEGDLDGICVPATDPEGVCLLALIGQIPVGIVSCSACHGDSVTILGMSLKQEMAGRYYADQMLGEVFSYARKHGATYLKAVPGVYPEDILERYGFSDSDLSRSIDANHFDWNDLSW